MNGWSPADVEMAYDLMYAHLLDSSDDLVLLVRISNSILNKEMALALM